MRFFCERIISAALLGLVMMAAITAASQTRAAGPVQIVLLSQGTPVTSISVGQGNLKQVDVKQMFFRASGQAGNSQDVTAQATWIVADPSIAFVFRGTIIGKKIGSTIVTVTKGPAHGSILVTVTAPPALLSIAVIEPDSGIGLGGHKQFDAIGVYADNSSKDITTSVSWSSSAPTVASIDNGGLASAVGAGATTITATSGNISGVAHLTVGLLSIAVTPANVIISNGASQQYTAMGHFADGIDRDVSTAVAWYSDLPSVATINSTGLASAAAPGGTHIQARAGSIQGSTLLMVDLVSLEVQPNVGRVDVSGSIPEGVIGHFSDGSTQGFSSSSFTWTSASPSVATVNNGGLVTGVSDGGTQITAAFRTVSGSAGILVGLQSFSLSPRDPIIPLRTSQQFKLNGSFSDNSVQDISSLAVRWGSNVPSVASVNASGLAQSLTQGSTQILVYLGPAGTTSTSLTVGPPALLSIAVTPASTSVPAGKTTQFIATGTYTDGSTNVITNAVAWKSSDGTIATINNAGLATGVKQGGPVTITASLGNATPGTASLTVSAPLLVSIAVTPANPRVTNGQTQQFTATGTYSDNSTQNLTSTATWSSSLPAVATINANTGLATAAAVGATTITATQNSISGSAGMKVTGLPARFAYTANFLDNTIEEYTVNANGQLRNNGYVFNGPNTGPQGVTVDPGNSYVYVANSNVNTVSAYAINSAGTLAAIAGSPFTAGNGPTMLAFSVRGNGGRSAYVTNGDNTISEFTVNGDGSLSLLTTTAPTTVTPQAIAVTANGLYAYVANLGASSGTGNIAQYSIAQGNGFLIPQLPATVAAPGFPEAILVDPFNRFVFVSDVNNTGGSVSAYKINNNGTLTFQNTLAAGKGAIALAVDPSGHFLYTANYISSNVSAFTIDQTSGALTAVVGTPTVAVGSSPQAVSIDSSGQFLYVGHFSSHEVWEYGIDGTSGALTFLHKIRSGKGVDGMAISSGSSPPVYTDFLAFDVNSAGVGEALVDGTSGALSAFSNNAPAAPTAVAVDPYQRFVYAIKKANNTVAQYTLGSFGAMTFNGAISTGNSPQALTVDPSGRFLYVSANDSTNAGTGVFGFTINQSSGLLTAISGGTKLGLGGGLLTTDPTGRFLFVQGNGIYVYNINPADGTLNSVPGSPFPESVVSQLVVDPSGKFLYLSVIDQGIYKLHTCLISAVNGSISCSLNLNQGVFGIAVEPYGRYAYAQTNQGVASYGIDQTTGFLTLLGSPVLAVGGNLTVDFQGQYVYSANSNSISAYKIDPNTGAITEVTGSPFAAGINPGSVVISGFIQ